MSYFLCITKKKKKKKNLKNNVVTDRCPTSLPRLDQMTVLNLITHSSKINDCT